VLGGDLVGDLINVRVFNDSIRVREFIEGFLTPCRHIVEVFLVFLYFFLVVASAVIGFILTFLHLFLHLFKLDTFSSFVKVADHDCQEEVPHDYLPNDNYNNKVNQKLY